VTPALFALFLALSDLFFVTYYLKESLSLKHRATTLAKGLSGAISYINPVDLFQFNGVLNLSRQGILENIYISNISKAFSLEIYFIIIFYVINNYNLIFRSTRFEDIGPSIFYISSYIQWFGVYSDILDSSYIRIYEYATRLDVSWDWSDYGSFTGWMGTTYTSE